MQARLHEYLLNTKKPCDLILCENNKEAMLLGDVAKLHKLNAFILPDFRAEFGDDLRSFSKELFEICKVLNAYYKLNENKILISPVATILNKLPSKKHLQSFILKKNKSLNLNEFSDELERLGYEFVDIVQDKGEVSIRGEIIDIFAINNENPSRVLLFEDEIESIRFFDTFSQKTFKDEFDFLEICPFLNYFNTNDYSKFKENLNKFQNKALINDINSQGFWCVEDFFDYLKLDFRAVKKLDLASEFEFINEKVLNPALKFKDINLHYNKDFFSFHKDKKITILAKNDGLFNALELEKTPNLSFVKSDLIINLMSENELIISLNKTGKARKIRKASLIIDELKKDDFITHEDYGVGKFLGLEMIEVGGAKKEFVAILYQNNDKLLLPVENLYMIDKYIANGAIPALDKLGKGTFLKLKEKLKEKLFAIASHIVILAAKRALIKPKDIKINENELNYFISKAGFDYTEDQIKACEQINLELSSGKLMDKLLSGDVGFGKTEVAMNAIFSVIKSGFSALFFVPTTLLSHQHYKSLKKRFSEFDILIFKLDRFTSSKEKSAMHAALSQNKPCVIIGTHALLNVKCENLGLIIIDEEHKFGVKQKEKLKQLSENSHILAMSATPIPRSLNQALSQIKTYSVLQTPPSDRLDVRTFVRESDESIIKEAILRELRRGGQVFYIHNHIASIEETKKELLSLMPNLRVLILHSKIDAKLTEEQILKFEEKEYDLLLCTSIVESGIDLANVNTIIVENADRFGMADLHQLRGRVGRSSRQGYCYFLIENKNNISQDAIKRLLSLENNSFLGAGSVLAYHDLEIRGGGNLLGVDQSGHIEQIGLNLYLKMLENELNTLSKNELASENKLDLKLNVNAFLNPDLIAEDRLRLELYRRLSKCEEVGQVYDIESEIEDRFGKLDIYTKAFLNLILIKILATNKFIKISNYAQNISLTDINENKQTLISPSRDDDDIINTILIFLRKN